jgi:hypothetical protein
MDMTVNEIPPGVGYEIRAFPTITLFKAYSNERKELTSGKRSLPGIF